MVPWSQFEAKLIQHIPNAKDDEDGLENLRYILGMFYCSQITHTHTQAKKFY